MGTKTWQELSGHCPDLFLASYPTHILLLGIYGKVTGQPYTLSISFSWPEGVGWPNGWKWSVEGRILPKLDVERRQPFRSMSTLAK